MSLLLSASAAGVGALSALAVPRLIRALPEPDPRPLEPIEPMETEAPFETEAPRETHDLKETYAAISALPGLALWSALVGAVSGAIIGLSLDDLVDLVLWLPLVPVGIALGLIDLRTKLLPARLVLPATAYVVLVGVVASVAELEADGVVRGLIGLVAARSLFWLFWRVHPRGMGFGDVRLAAVLGFALAHLGWAELVVGIYAAFPMLGVPGLLLAILTWDRAQLRKAYPFGPAMLVGALVGLAAGEPLVSRLFST